MVRVRARFLANLVWALSAADWNLDEHEPAVSQLVADWCQLIHPQLHTLRPADVSQICTALGSVHSRVHPNFEKGFYRSVLEQQPLLSELNLVQLNNLLHGLSRARRKGLTGLGSGAYKLLYDTIRELLAREDRKAIRLDPASAAQLVYHCHFLDLQLRAREYSTLMPLVEQLYTLQPNPMDAWSFDFLTGFVDAHRRVSRRNRGDIQPLYDYLERRLPEATTSELAMLSHVFGELRFPLPARFWQHVFSRYLGGVEAPLRLVAPGGQLLSVYQRSAAAQHRQHAHGQPHQRQQSQEYAPPLPSQQRVPAQEQQQQQQQQVHAHNQQQEPCSEWPGLQQEQNQEHSPAVQLLSRPPLLLAPLPPQMSQPRQMPPPAREELVHRQQPQQHADVNEYVVHQERRHHQHHHQQNQQQQQHDRQPVEGQEHAHGPHRRWQLPARQGQIPGHGQDQDRQPVTPHPPRLVLLPPPSVPQVLTPRRSLPARPLPQLQHRLELTSQQQEPQEASRQQLAHAERVDGHPRGVEAGAQPVSVQQPNWTATPPASSRPQHSAWNCQPNPRTQPGQGQGHGLMQKSSLPATAAAAPPPQQPPRSQHFGRLLEPSKDDWARPRTLNYVCWQAAKRDILPPPEVLRLYLQRVPSWLVREASDKEVAQAVMMMRLYGWVPPISVQQRVVYAVQRRRPSSPLLMRKLLWLLRASNWIAAQQRRRGPHRYVRPRRALDE